MKLLKVGSFLNSPPPPPTQSNGSGRMVECEVIEREKAGVGYGAGSE